MRSRVYAPAPEVRENTDYKKHKYFDSAILCRSLWTLEALVMGQLSGRNAPRHAHSQWFRYDTFRSQPQQNDAAERNCASHRRSFPVVTVGTSIPRHSSCAHMGSHLVPPISIATLFHNDSVMRFFHPLFSHGCSHIQPATSFSSKLFFAHCFLWIRLKAEICNQANPSKAAVLLDYYSLVKA